MQLPPGDRHGVHGLHVGLRGEEAENPQFTDDDALR